MPHKKLKKASEKLSEKRKDVQHGRGLRRRRVKRNEPETKTGKVQATVKQTKKASSEVKKYLGVKTFGKVGGGSKDNGGMGDELTDLPGVGEKTAMNLQKRGYTSPRDVRQASIGELSGVPGVGDKRAGDLTGRVGGGGGSSGDSKGRINSTLDKVFGEDRKEKGLPDLGGGGGLPDLNEGGGSLTNMRSGGGSKKGIDEMFEDR